MLRKHITGKTFKLFSFFFELVFIKGKFKLLSISKPLNKTLYRYEVA